MNTTKIMILISTMLLLLPYGQAMQQSPLHITNIISGGSSSSETPLINTTSIVKGNLITWSSAPAYAISQKGLYWTGNDNSQDVEAWIQHSYNAFANSYELFWSMNLAGSEVARANLQYKNGLPLFEYKASPVAIQANTYDLGRIGTPWKDIYAQGVLSNGTANKTISEIIAGSSGSAEIPAINQSSGLAKRNITIGSAVVTYYNGDGSLTKYGASKAYPGYFGIESWSNETAYQADDIGGYLGGTYTPTGSDYQSYFGYNNEGVVTVCDNDATDSARDACSLQIKGYSGGTPKSWDLHVGSTGTGDKKTLYTTYSGIGPGTGGDWIITLAATNRKMDIGGELTATGFKSDGTGKALCVKSDGNIGTCSTAVGASGTCTCG